MSGLTPEQQQLLEFDRNQGLNDFYYFAKRILHYDLEPNPHREVCRFIADETHKCKLDLEPRGSFKTSIISQAYAIWRIVKNPNMRILLDSVKLGNSQDNVRVIENHFENNQRLRTIYGDFSGKKEKWNETECIVTKRTDYRLKEPTARASGIDNVQIGPHYPCIIVDDIHDKYNYDTPEKVRKVKEHLRLIFGLLEPDGEIIIVGTRWAYNDAISMVLGDTEDEEDRKFAELFKGATRIKAAEDEQGKLYFPTRLDRAHLKRQWIALGKDLYASQMMNSPVMAGDDQKFPARLFVRYEKLPRDIVWRMTVDPGGEKKKSDKWVFFVFGTDTGGNKYFFKYVKKTMGQTEAAETIYKLWKLNNIREIGFETAGQMSIVLTAIREYIKIKYHEAPRFIPLIHSRDSKGERIEALQPEYEMGMIFHSSQMKEPYGLEDQLQRFPKGEDDIADAAAMTKEISKAAKMTPEEKKEPVTLDERIAARIREQEAGMTSGRIQRIHPVLGSDF